MSSDLGGSRSDRFMELPRWEATRLPDWTWEAYEKADEGRYYGRVKSPNTYGNWEWGYFTAEQLQTRRRLPS